MTSRLTTSEAGKILGCSANYIRILIARGNVKAVKYGRDLFVDKKSLMKYKEKYARRDI